MSDSSPIRFSVIVPTYNYGRYLPYAIDSVLAQRSEQDEIIVVDDASTDNTPAIARHYGDGIVYLRLEENVGPGGAWAAGLATASGRYVCKLDADDWHLNGSLDHFEEAFEKHPSAGMVAGGVYAFHEDAGRVLRVPVGAPTGVLDASEFRERILRGFFFHMPGMSVRRSALRSALPRSDLWMPHDWEYVIRALKGWSCIVIDQPLAVYRVHSSSVTRTAEQAMRLKDDLERLSHLALDPQSALEMDESESRMFHAALGEIYLRLAPLLGTRPAQLVSRLRFASQLSGRVPGNRRMSQITMVARVLRLKIRSFVMWGFKGETPSVDDLMPSSYLSTPIDD